MLFFCVAKGKKLKTIYAHCTYNIRLCIRESWSMSPGNIFITFSVTIISYSRVVVKNEKLAQRKNKMRKKIRIHLHCSATEVRVCRGNRVSRICGFEK